MSTSRAEQWAQLPPEHQLRQIAYDLDELEARQQAADARLAKIFALVLGVLVSVLSACVMLAIQLGATG